MRLDRFKVLFILLASGFPASDMNASLDSDITPTVIKSPTRIIRFANPELKAAIEETLGIRDPNERDILRLENLDLSNKLLGSIEGLQYAKQLKRLNLQTNQIHDISALSDLTRLEELNLIQNRLIDVTVLKRLVRLKRLELNLNRIQNISWISELKDLSELDLSSNEIEEISPLSSLHELRKLNIGANQIADLSPIARLCKLEELLISFNNVRSISCLSGLTKLKILAVSHCDLSNMNELSKFSNLEFLNAAENRFSDISGIEALSNLKALNLGKNEISNVSAFVTLRNLEILSLHSNNLTDPSPLSALTGIKSIDLSNNPLRESSVLPLQSPSRKVVFNSVEPISQCEVTYYHPAVGYAGTLRTVAKNKDDDDYLDMRKFPGEIFWSRSGKEGRRNLLELMGLSLNRYTFAHIWLLSQTGQLCILSSEKILRVDQDRKMTVPISLPEDLLLLPKFCLDDGGEHLIVTAYRRFGPAAEQDVILAVDMISGRTTIVPLQGGSLISCRFQSIGDGNFIAAFKNDPLTTKDPIQTGNKSILGWYFLSIEFLPSGEVHTRIQDRRSNMPEVLGLLSNQVIGADKIYAGQTQILYANRIFQLEGYLNRYGITNSALWIRDSKRNFFQLKNNGDFQRLASYGDAEIIGAGSNDDSFWIVLADGTLDEFSDSQKRSHLALPESTR